MALAGIFMVVVAFLIPVAMTLVQNIRANTQQAQLFVAGAQNAAKAGLEDALGYFVRQNTILRALSFQTLEATPTAYATTMTYVDQPFNPIYNTSNAAYSDTFQGTTVNLPTIAHAFYGICNEYPLDASTLTIPAAGSTQVLSVYFARYEVQEQVNPYATAGVTLTPNPLAVHDISGNRTTNYMNGDGLAWAISSTGYIYKRMDYTVDDYGEYLVPYNTYPNKVLATAKAYTEFRKLSCTLPQPFSTPSAPTTSYASVYASAASDVTVTYPSNMGGVMSNGYGFCAMGGAAGATTPNGGGTTDVFGACTIMYTGASGGEGATANGPISDINVFGMSLKDIQFIADYVGNSSGPIPMTIQEAYKLSYFTGNLTYGWDQSAPYQKLDTTGILCVNGNLTLETTNVASTVTNSYFSGIIFCTGNMTIQAGSIVDGMVVMGYSAASTNTSPPQLNIQGSAGNYTYLTADPEAVKNVIQQVATYREDISARKVLLAFPGI
jgi:hypothetical protein